jgi:hypothetical protein
MGRRQRGKDTQHERIRLEKNIERVNGERLNEKS